MPVHVAQVLMATVAMSTHCATSVFASCKSIKMILPVCHPSGFTAPAAFAQLFRVTKGAQTLASVLS